MRLPIEWVALGFAAVQPGLTFLSDPLYRQLWFVGRLMAFDGRGHGLRRGPRRTGNHPLDEPRSLPAPYAYVYA